MKTIQRAALLLALLWSAMLSANETELPSIPAVSSPVQGIVTAGRLDADNVRSVHEAGIRHVIDLTLDEEPPDFDEAAAVRDAGMRYSNLPVQGASGLTLKTSRHSTHCCGNPSVRYSSIAAAVIASVRWRPCEQRGWKARRWRRRLRSARSGEYAVLKTRSADESTRDSAWAWIYRGLYLPAPS